MSNETTKRMIAAYNQAAEGVTRLGFLAGFFQSPPQNFHTSEEVEIDIVRSDEEVSIVIQDLSTGYRMNSNDLYVNKGFKPPIHKEAIALNAFDLIKRMPGDNPFESPNYRANLISRMFDGMVKVEAKIRRAIELQASQVLQTGVLTLTDSNGNALYTLDYSPKATHFPTAGTAWNAAGADPLGDLKALSEVIRNDGLQDPDQLIMGCDAFMAFIANDEVQKHYDNRRIDQGTIAPMVMRGDGGNYRGIVEIGNYRFDIWTYGGRYNDPQTGNKVQFVDPGKVIMRASGGRLDATFGAIPNIGRALGRNQLLPELPGRISSSERSMDLSTNAWITPDGEQMFGGVGARPLLIPTAIDTFGCLDTGV